MILAFLDEMLDCSNSELKFVLTEEITNYTFLKEFVSFLQSWML